MTSPTTMSQPISSRALYAELLNVTQEILAHIKAERWEAIQASDDKRQRLIHCLQTQNDTPTHSADDINERRDILAKLIALDAEILSLAEPKHQELRDILRRTRAMHQGFGPSGYEQV